MIFFVVVSYILIYSRLSLKKLYFEKFFSKKFFLTDYQSIKFFFEAAKKLFSKKCIPYNKLNINKNVGS